MIKDFLSDIEEKFSIPVFFESVSEATPGRKTIRIIIMSSPEYVTGTIRTLHRLGFAEAGQWSPLFPAPYPGEVMSILTRDIPAER